MTKEITKAILLQQLQDRFKLRDYETEKFLFSETVIPIYDIGKLIPHYINGYTSVNITSASAFKFHTVPMNERWQLERYDVVPMGAGAFTIAGVYLQRALSDFIYLDLEAGQTAAYHVNLPVTVTMEPGDALWVNIDGYTSTQALRLYIDYAVEEIR